MAERIKELDYLKCIFIVLMVAFHLVYIGDKYPFAKQVVYTFHMPGFLLISGYLLNVNRDIQSFLRKFLWIFIPYAVMEAGYVLAASVLPVREPMGGALSLPLLLDKVFLHPMGPYWYLHTLIVCSLLTYIVLRAGNGSLRSGGANLTLSRVKWKANDVKLLIRILFLLVLFYMLSRYGGVLNFSNACYFLFGVIIAMSGEAFTRFFISRLWAIIVVVLLFSYYENLSRASAGNVFNVFFIISFLLATYRYIPSRIAKITGFIGRNTLVILLFSPIFTMLSKVLVPLFAFDPTGMLFLLVAVSLTLAGSFGIARCMDKTGFSRWFFGRGQVLNGGITHFA